MSFKHKFNDRIKRRLFQKSETKRYLYSFLLKKFFFSHFFNFFFLCATSYNMLIEDLFHYFRVEM